MLRGRTQNVALCYLLSSVSTAKMDIGFVSISATGSSRLADVYHRVACLSLFGMRPVRLGQGELLSSPLTPDYVGKTQKDFRFSGLSFYKDLLLPARA